MKTQLVRHSTNYHNNVHEIITRVWTIAPISEENLHLMWYNPREKMPVQNDVKKSYILLCKESSDYHSAFLWKNRTFWTTLCQDFSDK